MLPVLVFAVVWGAYVIQQRATDLQSQLEQRAQLLARQMAVAADYGIFSGNLGALQSLTHAVSKEPTVVAATIYDAEFQILVTHRSVEGVVATAPLDVRAMANAFATLGRAKANQPDSGWFAYLEPIRSPLLSIDDVPETRAPMANNPISGYAVVEVSSESIRAELLIFVVSVVALLGGVLASSWIIVHNFSTRIDRRIQAVADAARQIGKGKTGVRLGPSNIATFDRLSIGLNSMAERLEQSRAELEKRVEAATLAMRQQRDAAERANTAKTRFLAAASHDLRQPMHALSLLFDALRLEHSPGPRDDLLARIESTTAVMGSLLDTLLDISRLDAGGVVARVETCELLPVLMRIRDTHEVLAQHKGVELHVRPSKLWVSTDPALLQRIIGNFVSNAIRYTPTGGRVLVSARTRGQQCLIQVRDTGPGIAPEHQQTIFDEFVQIHNPQRDRSQGIGLGLAIVQRLASLLQHRVSLRSCPGRGSSFAVWLPLALPVPQSGTKSIGEPVIPVVPASLASAKLQHCQVLLVEDDELVRESYERLLLLWGCNVISGTSKTTALMQLETLGWSPHVIISDYALGEDGNGLALIAAIRQHQNWAVPAALITGNTEDAELRTLSDNNTRLLYKPVKPAVLMKTLLELLSASPSARAQQ